MSFLKKILLALFILPFIFFKENEKVKIDSNPCPLGTFNGVCISYRDTREKLDELGASLVHAWFHWDYTEPEIFKPFVKVEDVTEAMIEAYSSGKRTGIDWSGTDAQMKEFEGLTFIIGVGSGWLVDMPFYKGERITPDNIGREYYLGQLYLFTRSCVRRYKSQVLAWQIENEPNVAAEMVLLNIRKGNSWYDSEFMTTVLKLLEKAVRAEDPEAWITINFHTDLHYKKEVKEWLPLVDMVGIDVYPNYFNGEHIKPDTVLSRVKQTKEISEGKPVFVMETGYSSAPSEMGYSEKKQSEYIDKVYSKIFEVGGCGVFYYKLTTAEEHGFTILPQENYWGLTRKDGSYKPAWFTLKKYID